MTRGNLVLAIVTILLFVGGAFWRMNRVEKPVVAPSDPMEAQVASEPFRLEAMTRRLIVKVSQNFDGSSGFSIDVDRNREKRKSGQITRAQTEELVAFLQAEGLVSPPGRPESPRRFPFVQVRYGNVKSLQSVPEERLHEILRRAPVIGPVITSEMARSDDPYRTIIR